MPSNTVLAKNIEFWHWYPQLLVKDLSTDQLRWQPDGHDTSILFAIWHAYRATDDLIHGMVFQEPGVFTSADWQLRMPAAETGITPFGNGLSREQIARLDIGISDVLAYAGAVGASINRRLALLSDEQLAEEVKLPFFTGVYPVVDVMSRIETIAFFAIGHVSEHLGEVQFIKGLMGMKGAPL